MDSGGSFGTGRSGCLQTTHEIAVLGGRQAGLQGCLYPGQVALQQGDRIEPQAGKHFAAENAGGVGLQPLEDAVAQAKPIEAAILDAPDEILRQAVGAVGFHLVVQIVAGGRIGDFGDEFRYAQEVAFLVGSAKAAAFRFDAQEEVRLEPVAPDRRLESAVVPAPDPGSFETDAPNQPLRSKCGLPWTVSVTGEAR